LSEPKKESQTEEPSESLGDRWLYNGIVFFLLLPASVYFGLISGSVFGHILLPGFGAGLTIWRIAVTPEIRNHITINFTSKSKKQIVKGSPGASLIQADTIYSFPTHEKEPLTDNLVKAYTAMRKTVKGWSDPRWSSFYDWSRLDEEDPRTVFQIRRTAANLANLCDKAVTLFGEVNALRIEVNNLIDSEQEKRVQEFQPKFDSPMVKFGLFRISANGGNDDQLYLIHALVKEQTVKEHAEFRAIERVGNMKTWKLELLVTGQRLGNPLSQRLDTVTVTVATDDDAINFGQEVLDYVKSQEPTHKLQDKLKSVQELQGELIPLIERELSKEYLVAA
jgi:hypothetical protein